MPRKSYSLNRGSILTQGSLKALGSEVEQNTEEYGASFLLNVGLGDGKSEETFPQAVQYSKDRCDKQIGDVNQKIENLSNQLKELEIITDKTVEQECRMENQLEAFQGMLNNFEKGQSELLSLIQTADLKRHSDI